MGKKKITTEEFIRRAVEKHGDKFDYFKSIYVNNSTNVEIYCKVCDNIFYSTPANHTHKTKVGGCPYCSGKIKTTESFIKQSKKIHGDLYDYSQVVYVGTKDKVKIGCRIHGIFEITPSNHTHISRPHGCGRCARTTNKEDFILKARAVHVINIVTIRLFSSMLQRK